MNSKIIAAGVVVALCAVALIGVGYAYTATVTTQSNTIQSEYVVLDVTGGGGHAEALFKIKLSNETNTDDNAIEFSTKTNNSGTSWFAAGNQTITSLNGEKLVISGTNKTGNIDLTLTLSGADTPAERGILGSGATITFTKSSGDGAASIVYTSDGTGWNTSGQFTIGSTYSATITTAAIAEGSAVEGPPVIDFTMTLSFNSNPSS